MSCATSGTSMDLEQRVLMLPDRPRFPEGIKCLIMLLALIILSVPATANTRIITVGLGNLEVYATFSQLTVVLLSIGVVVITPGLRLGFSIRCLFVTWWLFSLYNLLVPLIVFDDAGAPTRRGLWNFAVNVLAAFVVSVVVRYWARPESFTSAVVGFGAVLAFSGIVEFVFLKLARPWLVDWREMVLGRAVPIGDLLVAEGVALDPRAPARVGGLIGSPDNLGYIIAATLPFVRLAELPFAAHGLLLGAYIVAAMVSGSRTLAIGLVIYGLCLIVSNRHRIRGRTVAATVGLLLAATVFLGPNLDSLARLSPERLLGEWGWRSRKLIRVVGAMRERPSRWLTGLYSEQESTPFGEPRDVTGGILGGDVAVACAVYGIGGFAVWAALWAMIVTVRRGAGPSGAVTRSAMDTYMLFVALTSLIMPMLMTVVLFSGPLAVLLVAFVMICDDATSLKQEVPFVGLSVV